MEVEACLGHSDGDPVPGTGREVKKNGEYQELMEYLRSFNSEIPEDVLEKVNSKSHEENDIDLKVQVMWALFDKFCPTTYEVRAVAPQMSLERPYCRWLVKYYKTIRYEDYQYWDSHLLATARPPQVYPTDVPNRPPYINVVLEFGVKHCVCVKPTEPHVTRFNDRYTFINKYCVV